MKDNTPSLSLMMNTYAALGGLGGNDENNGNGQFGGSREEIDRFLSAVPENLKRRLRAAIISDDEQQAIALTCGYVIKFFEYIPSSSCMYHGKFVYELLKRAMAREI